MFFLVLGGQLWAFYAGSVPLGFALLASAYLFFFLFGKKAVMRAKERWVFPRTGRIELRQPKFEWRKGLVPWLIMMAFWALMIVFEVPVDRWMGVAAGLTFTACLLGVGVYLRLRRHFVTGALTLALTVIVAVNGYHDQRDMAILMLGAGAILLLSGGVALALFLHTAPLAAQD